MPTWTDARVEGLITMCVASPDPEGAFAELDRARAELEAERGAAAPGLDGVWRALVELAMRQPEAELRIRTAEGRAAWATAALGASHRETLCALADLADFADEDCRFDTATRAWERIVAVPLGEDASDEDRSRLSRALRGLGARRLAADRFDDAVACFERDLSIREHLGNADPHELALSLQNLAHALEKAGDRARAAAVEERRLAHLEAAYGSGDPRVQAARARVAGLRAPRS